MPTRFWLGLGSHQPICIVIPSARPNRNITREELWRNNRQHRLLFENSLFWLLAKMQLNLNPLRFTGDLMDVNTNGKTTENLKSDKPKQNAFSDTLCQTQSVCKNKC